MKRGESLPEKDLLPSPWAGKTSVGLRIPLEDLRDAPRPHLELWDPSWALGPLWSLHHPPGRWWQRGCGSTC